MTRSKVRLGVRRYAVVAGFLAFAALGTYAQSEVDPDHFASPNTESIPQPKPAPNSQAGATQYEGKVTLPYSVQCNGKNLPPGEYSVSFRSDGKVGQGVLKSRNQSVGIVGRVRQQSRKLDGDALIVEKTRSARILSVIQAAELEFVLEAKQSEKNASSGKNGSIEKLPLLAVITSPRTTGQP